MLNFFSRFSAIAFAACVGATVQAQDIAITDPGRVLIPDGGGFSDVPTTQFPNTILGDNYSRQFFVFNDSESAVLNIIAVSITGTNASDFVVADISSNTVPPNDNAGSSIIISFNPQALGSKTATLHVFSNDPDDESDYTFELRGLAVPVAGTPLPNVRINASTQPVVTAKGSSFKVKGFFEVENNGPGQVDAGTIDYLATSKRYLDSSSILLKTVKLKKMKAFDPQKPKVKKYKFNFVVPTAPGRLFAIARPTNPVGDDAEWSDNTATVGYPSPF